MIDWNEAPDGATHHARMSNLEYLDYWLDDRGYWTEGNHYEFELETDDGENFKRREFCKITQRPLPVKPVYTQEMNDNVNWNNPDSLPEIGEWFIDIELGDEMPVQAIAHDFGCVIYRSHQTKIDAEYFRAELHECRMIESPPKPVEPIDGKAYQFDYTEGDGRNLHGIYCNVLNSFYLGIATVKASACTNITALTLEDK